MRLPASTTGPVTKVDEKLTPQLGRRSSVCHLRENATDQEGRQAETPPLPLGSACHRKRARCAEARAGGGTALMCGTCAPWAANEAGVGLRYHERCVNRA